LKIKAKNMKIYFQKIDPSAKLPSYAYEGDAGMDLFSCHDVEIKPDTREIIATGLKVAVPNGHAGFVWDKSGISIKNHVTTLAGVIDSNYRGELHVALTNLGRKIYKVKKGEKIAQLVIKPVLRAEIVEVEKIEENEVRGERGFGSSGLV